MARAWIWVLAAALVSVSWGDGKLHVLELTSTQTGVKFTLAGEGIEVELK